MRISVDYISVTIPYLRFSFSRCKSSPNFLRLPKADHVRVGSVVITRSDVAILDIGLVKSVRDGKPIEIYSRKDKYGGINQGHWYDTGIRMTLDKWCQLGHELEDEPWGFYNYWNNRLSG